MLNTQAHIALPSALSHTAHAVGAADCAALSVERLSVSYGGVRALCDVSMTLDAGCIYGLIGPNGAGKSTAINVITGLTKPSAGSLRLNRRDITHLPAHDRARAGLARTFQNLALFPTLTVRENIACGRLAARASGRTSRNDSAGHSDSDAIDRTLDTFALQAIQHQPTQVQSLGTRKRIELARAWVAQPALLLLDEPAAGLSPGERDDLAQRLRTLRDGGATVLIVEHDMGLVMSLCQHLFVLDFGCLIAQGSPAQVQADPLVRAAYFGDGDGDGAA